jgi:hypothetical protein
LDLLVGGWKSKKPGYEEDAPGEDEDDSDRAKTTTDVAKYSQFTRTTLSVVDEQVINFDLIVDLLEHICFGNGAFVEQYSSAILIFLPVRRQPFGMSSL